MNFTFNGIDSQQYGLVCRSKNRPILPKIRSQYEDIPGRDGSYDFSDGTLEDRIIEISCQFISTDVSNLRDRVRNMAAWLYSSGKKSQLIFSDEPDVCYMGRLANQIDLEQIASYGEFTLMFRCDPHAFLLDDVNVEQLDQVTILNRTRRLVDVYSNLITSSGTTFTINNFGTASVRPRMLITGTCSAPVTISVEGVGSITFAETLSNSEVVIDHEKFTAMVGITNKLDKVRGNFLELLPGDNNVTVTSTGTINLTVRFLFNPRYL